MLARYTYIGRGQAWLPVGFLLALAVAGPARAARPAADPPVATTAVPAQAGAAPKQADQPIPEPMAGVAVLRARDQGLQALGAGHSAPSPRSANRPCRR